MRDHNIYASFLIRLWHYGDGARTNNDKKVKFEIEHIQSGKIHLLDTAEGILEFITSVADLPRAPD